MFLLMFMENTVEADDNVQVEIFMMPASSDISSTNVNITVFDQSLQALSSITKTITRGDNDNFVKLDNSIRHGTNNAIEKKGILITADNAIVAYGVNKREYSADAFFILPTTVLGSFYYAVTYGNPTNNAQLGVAAMVNQTQIRIDFPSVSANAQPIEVDYNGQTYDSSNPLVVTLNALESLNIKAKNKADLTGTTIQSLDVGKKIAVFSGNVRTAIQPVGSESNTDWKTRDHLVEQMPPVNTWGRRFVFTPIPNRLSDTGTRLKILASVDNTAVTIYGVQNDLGSDTYDLNRGQFRDIQIANGRYVYITSTEPIIAVIFVLSAKPNTEEKHDPAMIVIPPIEQWDSFYAFTPPVGVGVTYDHYVLIAIETSQINGLRLNGEALSSNLNWTVVLDGDNPSSYSATHLSYTSPDTSYYTLSHIDNQVFMGVLYGSGTWESYGLAIGQRYQIINEVQLQCMK